MSPAGATSPERPDGIQNITDLCSTRPDYEFNMDSLPTPGETTTMRELLFCTGKIGEDLLKGKHVGASKPSISVLSGTDPAHTVEVVRPKHSPGLFLTQEMLDSKVVMTRRLYGMLDTWAESTPPDPINENRITTAILNPLFLIWLTIWTDASRDPATKRRKWDTRPLDPSNGGGDIDVLITRAMKGTGSYVEVAAIEAKTPLSCGHDDIVDFGKGKARNLKNDALSRQCIRHLIRCSKSAMEKHAPWPRQPTFGALTVYPGHFFPIAYQEDTNRFVAFPDASDVETAWPDTRDKLENHMKASSLVAAWAFMLVVTTDDDVKEHWDKVCPKQVDQAVQWRTTAGEHLASRNRVIATLTGGWAAVSALFHQTIFWLTVSLIPLERFQALQLRNGDEIVIEPETNRWRLPSSLTLPLPDRFHESYTAQTYVLSWPQIVVKVYDDVGQYAHELAFYEKWSSVLGSAIPALYAKGRRTDDNKPFLIISNKGEPITELTEADRAIVQESVLGVIHKEGWHHHDLAARNVLRKPSGGLCLIDFGMASECERQGCDDIWE
ncbi:hypothetical protein FA13DRAFT_1715780 [Coprinellus micaceus]|uniref:Protein kinase domain-containing protein n=1 Tax=Coprinellus micaceus TaxID=71717 RepID=A0A4Y7SLQ3_COPMI|nr:hypothetical protein FA13DRAFT_1715780 [Coprinellus micaceus]